MAQKYQNQAFSVANLGIVILLQKIANWQIWGCLYQIWQKFLKILSQKDPKKEFLVPNFGIFFPCKTLKFDKFEGTDFKYGNSSYTININSY